MKRILVAYTTFSGSTSEVARAIGEEIAKSGLQVEVLPAGEVKSLEGYDGVVVGGPMIMGWHRPALGFLKKHRDAFRRIPLAVFITALSLTQTGDTSVDGLPVYVDERLPKPPEQAGRLSFRERHATLGNYLRPILAATRPGEAGEHRGFRRQAGIRPPEVVGRVVRDGDYPGSGRRAAKLVCDPILGVGAARGPPPGYAGSRRPGVRLLDFGPAATPNEDFKNGSGSIEVPDRMGRRVCRLLRGV